MYCKQWIMQLDFEQKVSYGNIARDLAAEGCRLTVTQCSFETLSDHKTLNLGTL